MLLKLRPQHAPVLSVSEDPSYFSLVVFLIFSVNISVFFPSSWSAAFLLFLEVCFILSGHFGCFTVKIKVLPVCVGPKEQLPGWSVLTHNAPVSCSLRLFDWQSMNQTLDYLIRFYSSWFWSCLSFRSHFVCLFYVFQCLQFSSCTHFLKACLRHKSKQKRFSCGLKLYVPINVLFSKRHFVCRRHSNINKHLSEPAERKTNDLDLRILFLYSEHTNTQWQIFYMSH